MSVAFRSAFAAASRRTAASIPSAPIAPARVAFQAHGHARYRGFSTADDAYASSSRGPSAFRRWTTRFGMPPESTGKSGADPVGILLAIPVVYVAGAAFPPQLVLLLYPRYSPPPPDKDSTRGKAITCEVEQDAQNLSIVEKMRAADGWYETSESSLRREFDRSTLTSRTLQNLRS
jgi:hypothetical protein